MSTSHILRQYPYTDADGNAQTLDVYEAQRGTRGGVTGQRWYTCHQCRYDYPENQISLIQGVPYCNVNGCATAKEEEELNK